MAGVIQPVGGGAPRLPIKETITPASPRLSRMENLLMPTNYFDRMYRSTHSTKRFITQIKQDFQVRRLGYHGKVQEDKQYQGTLDFSTDDGRTFSAPAIGITGNTVVQLRLQLSQYQVNPPVRGWALNWYLPAGWVWLDGLGTTTYEEAVSNPMVVTRPTRSPNNPQPVGFRILIAEKFL